MNFNAPWFRPNVQQLKKKRDLKGLVNAFLYGSEEGEQALKALEEINTSECALMIAIVLKDHGFSDESKKKFLDVLLKLDASHTIEGLLAYALNEPLLQHSSNPLDKEIKSQLARLSALASPQQLARYPQYLRLTDDKSKIQQLLEKIKPESLCTYQRELDQLFELGWQPQTAYHQALALARRGAWESAAAAGMEALYPLLAWRLQVEQDFHELEKLKHLAPIDPLKTQAYLDQSARLNQILLGLGPIVIGPLLKLCEKNPLANDDFHPGARVACPLLVEIVQHHSEFRNEIIQSWTALLEQRNAPREIGPALYQIAPASNVRLMIANQFAYLVEQAGETAIIPLCEIDHDQRILLSDYDREQAVQILIKLLPQYPQYDGPIERFFESRLASAEIREYCALRSALNKITWHPQTTVLRIFQQIFQHDWQGCLEKGEAAAFPLLKDLNFHCKTRRDYLTAQAITETLNALYVSGKLSPSLKKAIEAQDGQVIISAFTPPTVGVFWDGWQDRPSDETLDTVLSSPTPKSEPVFVFHLARKK